MKTRLPMILFLALLACGKPAADGPADPAREAANALFEAIEKNDIAKVRDLLLAGTPVDVVDASGRTPFLAAVGNGHQPLAGLLLEHGADRNARLAGQQTALMLTVERNNSNLAGFLIANKADLEATDGNGATALWHACSRGNAAMAALLLHHGAVVNPPPGAPSPLFAAAGARNPALVKMLLASGANPKTATEGEKTVLTEAIVAGDTELAGLLIRSGAPLNSRKPEKEWDFSPSPLTLAISLSNQALVSMLLQAGAKIDEAGLDGHTPLILAIKMNMEDLAERLVKAGANVNLTNKDYYDMMNPLTAAVSTGSLRLVRFLLDKGAAVDGTPEQFKANALQCAAYDGKLAIVRLLVERGADIQVSNFGSRGKSPLLLAIEQNHKPVAQFLLEEEQRRKRAQVAGTLADTPAPAKDYLSPSWARYQYAHPGGRRDDLAAMEEAVRRAADLQRRGFQEYKKKNDREAVRLYEEALDHHATAGIYYNYANSLSNLPRLEDALKAYQIALDLQHPEAFLVFYNMACAHARLKQREPALNQLRRAVAEGYAAFAYMEKDGDLAYLRAFPEWPAWLAELKAGAPGRAVTQSEEEVFKRLYLNRRLSNRANNVVLVFKATANTGEYGLGEYEITYIDENKIPENSGMRGESGNFRVSGNTLHLLNSFRAPRFTAEEGALVGTYST